MSETAFDPDTIRAARDALARACPLSLSKAQRDQRRAQIGELSRALGEPTPDDATAAAKAAARDYAAKTGRAANPSRIA